MKNNTEKIWSCKDELPSVREPASGEIWSVKSIYGILVYNTEEAYSSSNPGIASVLEKGDRFLTISSASLKFGMCEILTQTGKLGYIRLIDAKSRASLAIESSAPSRNA